jgi:hypothetical protein
MPACAPKPRTDDLQIKPATMRESDSIYIESREMRAKPKVVSLTRSRRETVTFRHLFRIKGIERRLPAGGRISMNRLHTAIETTPCVRQ